MANRIYAGSMHWLGVAFEDSPQNVKIRPVLILHTNDGIVYYYYITKQEGKNHQKKYRPFISDWRQSGLKAPSYIMIKNPPKIADEGDFKSNSYMGDITQKDADNISAFMDHLGY
ncbi:hypothetical protein [Salinicoccus albus]|uniref:hypothetical protein n=1 Tax=Salinicoccus albus TaxID=418756 RepID=UPI0003744E4D|nr:hypothetical protein [Salinicoccus albus]